MKPIKTTEWIPAGGMTLEKNALEVTRQIDNKLVVAGPGAGKTELLAQKACFLLQTNTCKFPHRILAISFKRDAAYNLKERVRLRCGDELSKRFDSMTFDSFAKQLLDRFKRALSSEYSVGEDYDLVLSDQSILELYQEEDELYYNTTDRALILRLHNQQLPLSTRDTGEKIRLAVWKRMLQQSKISFTMVMRLAEYIINSNPKVKRYLQQTYHFVFLDEFQDTTEIQYDFLKSCFLGSNTAYTAVGDDKQRIMMWAGARKTVFEDFITDLVAERIPLNMNFRCAPRLVMLLNHLTVHLLGKAEVASPSPKWSPDQGECSIWVFDNPESEKEILFEDVQKWIMVDGVDPRDICILIKQQLEQYAGQLIQYFIDSGIKARDENKFQDLLTQEVTVYLISVLRMVFEKKAVESKRAAFNFLSNLHAELEEHQLLKLEASLSAFIKRSKKNYQNTALTDEKINNLIDEIINLADKDRIRANFPAYRNRNELALIISSLKGHLVNGFAATKDIVSSLDMLVGRDTIPVMTIHKSKGLEYHTVIFVGLEDNAFWSFERQADEDKCAFFVALSRAKERVVFTFSRQRTGRYGLQKQSIKKIRVIFDELQKSGIVSMIQRDGT